MLRSNIHNDNHFNASLATSLSQWKQTYINAFQYRYLSSIGSNTMNNIHFLIKNEQTMQCKIVKNLVLVDVICITWIVRQENVSHLHCHSTESRRIQKPCKAISGCSLPNYFTHRPIRYTIGMHIGLTYYYVFMTAFQASLFISAEIKFAQRHATAMWGIPLAWNITGNFSIKWLETLTERMKVLTISGYSAIITILVVTSIFQPFPFLEHRTYTSIMTSKKYQKYMHM